MADDRQGPLNITIAVLTRDRPNMLGGLLRSLSKIELPAQCAAHCLIVENNEAAKVDSLVRSRSPLPNGLELCHVLETKLGIPFARNRAAKEALARGSQLLVFIDDDETAEENWLVELVRCYRDTDHLLVGGPVHYEKPEEPVSRLEKRMLECLQEDKRRSQEERSKSISTGNFKNVSIPTSNWLGDLRLFSEEKIWFDETIGFYGSEDTLFSNEVIRRGHSVGWCDKAVVSEVQPRDRLSFSYQRKRASSTSAMAFEKRIRQRPLSRYSLILRLPRKLIAIAFLTISLPLTGARNLLPLARTCGWVSGRINAALGRHVGIYKNVTGN